jgi:hypothetical protein
MSVFDPTSFAQMTFTEANSTESVPIPVGEWPATITKSEISAWQKKDDPSRGGLKCTLLLEVDDPAVATLTGRPKNSVRYEFMLDTTPEGGLDFGKGMNVSLGRARSAVGLNTPGTPFSFDMFVGRSCKAAVKHEEYQGRLLAKCTAIAAA